MPASDILVTLSLFSFCRFLIHRLACPCGSIIRLHRRERVTKMAFSTESESSGSPQMPQWRTATGSESTFATVGLSAHLMLSAFTLVTHDWLSRAR